MKQRAVHQTQHLFYRALIITGFIYQTYRTCNVQINFLAKRQLHDIFNVIDKDRHIICKKMMHSN